MTSVLPMFFGRTFGGDPLQLLQSGPEVFNDHLSAANHLGLLAEEVDPESGRLWGNYPQAFSHLGLIQAAARLDHALRLRDEGLSEPRR